MPRATGEWQPIFLKLLEETGDTKFATEKTAHKMHRGVQQMKQSVQTAKSRNPAFAEAWRSAMVRWGYLDLDIPKQFPADDFLAFRETCCAYRRQSDKQFVRATNQWFHKDAYERFQSTRRQINVFPPGHNKTTLYAIEMPTWLIMGDRDVRIGIVQKNATEAKKIVNAVQQRLSDHTYYNWLNEGLQQQGDELIANPLDAWFSKQPFRPETRRPGATWGAEQFTVEGRRSGEKDYTMQAFGVGSGIQGGRYDYIILDDIQDPLDSDNPQSSQKLLDWFERVIMGRITDTQTLIINGNFFSPDDFMHRLIAAHPEFTVANYPALIPKWRAAGFAEPQEDGDDKLVPLWPEYWTEQGLDVKRVDVGPRAWHHTWMQAPESFADSTFNRGAIDSCKDYDLSLLEIPQGVTDIYLGVDPAAAENGFCAMVLWGLNKKTKQRYLMDVFNRKGMRNWNNVIDQIAEYCRAFPIRKVIIEGNNTQKAGLTEHPYFRKTITELGTKWTVYQTVTGSGARAVQSNFDITTVGAMFDERLITIPYGGDFEEVARVDQYIDQLCAWRTDENGHSIKHLVRDMVMATLFAESEAFTTANRPTQKPVQRSKAPPWAKRAWGQRDKPKPRPNDGVRWLNSV